ncbi:hypothetical protein [Rhodanobacter sp. MP1X3]|uniref:hypothetical protein n=1 Tax=Rhodanobacter sp. MP1X3 TaxID=2723086 RepID=UPI00161376C2|nr:hypothetical protein [Rhodanobacter sp. MP1X3]MBB6243081.1 hypothetical protein [Rhodanobacter sp. MP1X3]
MGLLFTTSVGHRSPTDDEEAWKAFLAEIDEQTDPFLKDFGLKVWAAYRDYGRSRIDRRDNETVSYEILNPAGASRSFVLSDPGAATQIGVSFKQREIGRCGLPDIFAAYLYVQHEEGERQFISYSVPVKSEAEAFERFANALKSPWAEATYIACGEDDLCRVFGVAASPDCLNASLNIPVPTTRELGRVTDELGEALKSLLAVYEKWDGTDALNYLIQRSLGGRVRGRTGTYEANEQLVRLSAFRHTFKRSEKRSGRPILGGKNHLIARLLTKLWVCCGLGEPEFWNDSKFIRACTVVLPWHGIHKADVVQFMRGELAKKGGGYKAIVLID